MEPEVKPITSCAQAIPITPSLFINAITTPTTEEKIFGAAVIPTYIQGNFIALREPSVGRDNIFMALPTITNVAKVTEMLTVIKELLSTKYKIGNPTATIMSVDTATQMYPYHTD